MTDDWSDPFTDDEAAKEREQRRRARLAARVERASAKAAKEKQKPLPEPEPEPEPPPLEPMEGEPSAWAPRRPPVPAGSASATAYRRRRIAVFAVLAVLVLVGTFLVLLYQPFRGPGSGRVAVQIPKGASASQIADLLDQHGVVSNSTFFRLRLSLSGEAGNIQAGKYTLASGMSYGDAIDALTTSTKPLKPKTITVTIPEGYDRLQTAHLLKQDGVEGDYEKASVEHSGFDPAKYDARHPANLEGFLFPATYKLKPNQTVDDLVAQQLTAFGQQIKGVDMRYARSKNLTTYDVLIIASLIEREAQVEGDRAKVAAVIYNRLHAGMPLQIDATIRFAENNYTEPLGPSDLALDSPYNSYTNAGLPPGPISNPGIASIKAAAKPAKAPYIYYVNKPNTCGHLTFATTDAQFARAKAAYDRARAANGGNAPTPKSCPG